MIFRWLKWQLPFGYNIFFLSPCFSVSIYPDGKEATKKSRLRMGKTLEEEGVKVKVRGMSWSRCPSELVEGKIHGTPPFLKEKIMVFCKITWTDPLKMVIQQNLPHRFSSQIAFFLPTSRCWWFSHWSSGKKHTECEKQNVKGWLLELGAWQDRNSVPSKGWSMGPVHRG